jgi:hypothetical protein
MEFERVGSVSVGNLGLETFGQIDNLNGLKWALLNAHTATNAEVLGDEANCGGRFDVDAYLTSLVDGAGFDALALTFLGFALIGIDNRDSNLIVGIH